MEEFIPTTNDMDKQYSYQTDEEFDQRINDLDQQRKESELSGNLDKAIECRKEIKELKERQKQLKRKELAQLHISEMELLHQSYQQEIDKINEEWDKKFEDLEIRSKKAEDEIKKRQENEMNELYISVEKKFPKKVNPSKAYLSYDNQEKNLIKLQKYEEAKVIRKKKEEQMKKDNDKFTKEKNDKIKAQAVLKSSKHVQEKTVLKKKFEKELDELRKQKDIITERVDKKYLNKKLELEIQQKSEKNLNENDKFKKRQTNYNNNKTINTGSNFNKISNNINYSSNSGKKNKEIIKEEDTNKKTGDENFEGDGGEDNNNEGDNDDNKEEDDGGKNE